MLFLEILRVAVASLAANKLRAFLTLLGVIIGVGAVIAMVALGEGAKRDVQERIRALGTNTLSISPGQAMMRGVSGGDEKLTIDDVDALRREGRTLSRVAAEIMRSYPVDYRDANTLTAVVGTTPDYFAINNRRLRAGRLFNDNEVDGRRRVAVIGPTVLDNLGLTPGEIVGQKITIRGTLFEVIGALETQGQRGWWNPDDQVLIPLTTGQFRVFGTDRLRGISVQVAEGRRMDEAVAEIEGILRREHKIRPGKPNDFSIRNPAEIMGAFEETTRTFTMLLAGIAAVSLVVGGIGIMNIMLVSVTERTREIGIRKALGATRWNILYQFLVEAVVICLVGGILGIALGMGASTVMARTAGWNTAVSPRAIVYAFFFAAAVGVFFGIYPARRASRLDPIEALRYE
jgi:putative ABC transport system permease protein